MPHVFGKPDEDATFRALADRIRRRMLDELRVEPGLNVSDLTERLGVSRFSVQRHLKTLEEANLVVSRKVGRERELYLNAVPIQHVYDRWSSAHGSPLSRLLTTLKHQLEQEAVDMATVTARPKHYFVEYIRTRPEDLWEALTKPSGTRLFYHGLDVESDFQVGSRIAYLRPGENGERTVVLEGEILEVEPGRRLQHTFQFAEMEDAPTRVTYEIEPLGDVVRLSVLHEAFAGETETYRLTKDGWPPIVSGLKTLLETGKPLEIPAREHAS